MHPVKKGLTRPATLGLAAVLAIVLAGSIFFTARALDYRDVIDTYWRVHDEVLLPTEAGRRYIDIFWKYSPELCVLGSTYPEVMEEGKVLILQFDPLLRALVDGEGDQVVITKELVDRLEAYLDLLGQVGSPDLRAAIQSERARTPLRELIGMTFEEARGKLVGTPHATDRTPVGTNLPKASGALSPFRSNPAPRAQQLAGDLGPRP